jgi:hypothetical protein
MEIYGDLAHVLIGYAGRVSMFDIFRKYIVGDVVIRRSKDPYNSDNLIDEYAKSVKRFNDLIHEEDWMFEVLLVKHQWGNSKLYHIDIEGKAKEVKSYKSIGSDTKQRICFVRAIKVTKLR